MKLSIFKKVIREIIREELDYKFSRVRKELKEVVVNSNTNDLHEVKTHTTQATSLKNMMGDSPSTNTNAPKTNSNVPIPKTKNKEGKGGEVQSVQDNTEALPDHLAEALTKDYSTMLKTVQEKDNFKNGA